MIKDDLESLLIEMTSYGEPWISKSKSGWYCHIKMRVAAVGVDFEIKSDFGLDTPMQAAIQCRDRIIVTMKNIKSATGN